MADEKRKQVIERLRACSDLELAEELGKQRLRLFTLRRENVTKQLENTSAIPQTKKQIARVLTLMAERSTVEVGGE